MNYLVEETVKFSFEGIPVFFDTSSGFFAELGNEFFFWLCHTDSKSVFFQVISNHLAGAFQSFLY